MSLALEHIKTATLGDALARGMARIDEERTSWRKALIDTDIIGNQMRELVGNSAYAQMDKEIKELQSPALSIAKQYEDHLAVSSAIGSAYRAWQESQRAQVEQMRKMFDPMADVRKSVLGDMSTQQLINELTVGSSLSNHIKEITEQALGIGSVAKMLAQQAEDSRAHTKMLFDDLGVGSSIQRYSRTSSTSTKNGRCQTNCWASSALLKSCKIS